MWLRILGLAGAYFLAGRLGMLLAVPPGYATAFGPAAGIALAGLLVLGLRAWPGVLLAAFLLHVPTQFNSSSLVPSLGLPFTIGVGAALQAVIGAGLVRHCIGYPNPLNREQDIAALLLLGGPLSCLIGATTGVSCLWLSGRIQTGEIGLNWCTWWVGASIGVFLVAPAVMVWTARPQHDWRRPIMVSAPLLVLAGLVAALFVYTDAREQENIGYSFQFQTESLTRAVEGRIDHALESLHSMGNFHSSSPSSADHQRFSKAAKSILERRAAVQAFSWIPRVKDADRAEFEKLCRQTIEADFRMRERKPGGELEDATKRPVHYPILYREPAPSNAKTLGFDVASERLDVLEHAAGTGLPIASPPIARAQNKLGDKAVVVYLPIYRGDLVPDSIEERPEAVLGYIAAVLQVGKMVQLAWEGINSEGIDFWIHDEKASPQTQLAYFQGTPRGMSEMALIADKPRTCAAAMERKTEIEVAGRKWTLRFVQTPVYLAAQRSMQAWTVLAGGMILTGLLGGVLLVVTGRAELVAGLVEKRTAELGQANTALRQEIAERKLAVEALSLREESLRQSEERFRLLVDGTTDYAIFMLDPQGRVMSWNAGAERIKGYGAEEIIGQHVARFYTEEDIQAGRPQRHLQIALDEGRCEDETWSVRKDGSKFWVNMIYTVVRDAAGNIKGISKITRDLTERRQAEFAVEESRRFVQRIAEMVPSILYVHDLREQRIIFVNRRIESILGYSPEATTQPGMNLLRDNIHPDDLAKVDRANEQYQSAEDGAAIDTEYRMRHANGEWRWLHSRNTIFVRDADGNPSQILGTIQDITERKRLEQEVVDVAVAEQRRIGQELHDGTGQELTGLCMLADNLADALRESSPPDGQLARRIAQGLRQALGQVRALSRGLIPVEVDAEGLMAALTELTTRISDLHGLNCVFECAEPVPVEDNYTATQLYRIAQEAITNAIKHAQPHTIRVNLEARGHYLTLRIVDDGIGFSPAATNGDGMGLRIMSYRAGQIGAQFAVRPGPTRGAIVSCTLFRGISHA
jgi:PAS domain S-box-containing protein